MVTRLKKQKPPVGLVHQFLITLAEADPLVWRRIQVPAEYSFWDLHVAIQDAMGWLDCHLHQFTVVDPARWACVRFGIPGDDDPDDIPYTAGWKARIESYFRPGVPPALYAYDFGDDWQHAVIDEGPQVREDGVHYPRCIGGANACPPEDCGGIRGYYELLAVLADPDHEEYEASRLWAGATFDPAVFDPAAVKFDDPHERWKGAFQR